MRKLLSFVLFLSLAIEVLASDTYIYTSGLDSAIQHWQYPSTTAMNTDFGFFNQDVGKIAFNKGNGIYYYLADTTPTWTPMATGGGGGSTTFIGLVDVPASYAGAAGQLVAVNGTATGLVFQTAAGGGNVRNVGTPATEENAVWTDPTHVKGTRTLSGGSATYTLTKLSGTDYDYGWVAPAGGSTVSIHRLLRPGADRGADEAVQETVEVRRRLRLPSQLVHQVPPPCREVEPTEEDPVSDRPPG